MTDLYTVSINGVDGCTLHARVHLINPDAPYVPEKATFPLALLVDAWFLLTKGYLHTQSSRGGRGDRLPIPEEEAARTVAGMRLRDEFQELHDLVLGKEIQLSATEFTSGAPDPGEFARRAAGIVTSYEAGPLRSLPLYSEVAEVEDAYDPWPPGEREELARIHDEVDPAYERAWTLITTRPFSEWPSADITVTVRDAGYLEHMVDGMRWSTAHAG
ncbi:hypothetical protein [Streptomyces chattanoogensis]|uniref:Uncharacterized protein n=1 Tax=Streptomyces chattanoogensis TaxID=66876 RepID=A0A0N0Y146_9ACTN|nr:hypothetical protein [Streptomyces chattanoogensis]KPC66266.1 hypothetical protein ADL29_04815 [Streptomyces chattanoogensis]